MSVLAAGQLGPSSGSMELARHERVALGTMVLSRPVLPTVRWASVRARPSEA